MGAFKPFRGIRYERQRSGDLNRFICPPYDLISPREQEFYYGLHPHNAIRLDFGKILPGDHERENRYTRAKTVFRQWLAEGILIRDADPAYYLLEERFEDDEGEARVRYGVMGLRRLGDEGAAAAVRPHEATYAGPKQDRLELMKATAANLSPILAVYQDPTFLLERIFSEETGTNGFPFSVGEDGVGRRFFALREERQVRKLEEFFRERPLLIADGHHRYETALTYREWRRRREPGAAGEMPCDYTLMCLVNMESPGVCAYPTHRLVMDRPGMDSDAFLSAARGFFEVEDLGSFTDPAARKRLSLRLRTPPEGGVSFGCGLKDREGFYHFSAAPAERFAALFPAGTNPLIRTLDVSILHEVLVHRCLGLSPEDQAREDALAYAKGVDEALDSLARRPDLRVAFLLNRPDLRKIMEIAFSGSLLPRKTTFFFPKVFTGLVFREM